MASIHEAARYYPKKELQYCLDGPSVYDKTDPEIIELLNRIPTGARVLDVGAGDGRYTLLMLEKGLQVTAGDIDEEPLSILRQKTNTNQLTTKVFNAFEPFPFPDKSMDVVVCTSLLYPFLEEIIRDFMKATNQVLRDDGMLIFDLATNRKRVNRSGEEVPLTDVIQYDSNAGLQTISNTFSGLFVADTITKNQVESEFHGQLQHKTFLTRLSVLARKIPS